MRDVFQVLFPEGLTFRPAENAARRVWAISGTARLDSLKLSSDISGSRGNLRLPVAFDVAALRRSF